MVLKNGALDFHKRGGITGQLLGDRKNPVDDHHIFPQAYLDEKGKPTALRDCILNRTFIDRETNRRLKRRSPGDYFGEIRREQGEAPSDRLLDSHVLPSGASSPLLSNDFEGFLKWREKSLNGLIAHHTGTG